VSSYRGGIRSAAVQRIVRRWHRFLETCRRAPRTRPGDRRREGRDGRASASRAGFGGGRRGAGVSNVGGDRVDADAAEARGAREGSVMPTIAHRAL